MGHVELINRIIEAEQEAQRIAGEARERRSALPEETKESVQRLRQDLFLRADKRIEHVRRCEDEWAEESIAALDAQRAKDLTALESKFAEHRQEWAEKLFSLVVGG